MKRMMFWIAVRVLAGLVVLGNVGYVVTAKPPEDHISWLVVLVGAVLFVASALTPRRKTTIKLVLGRGDDGLEYSAEINGSARCVGSSASDAIGRMILYQPSARNRLHLSLREEITP